MGLRVVPCDLDEANRIVRLWHRHHDPVTGHKFSLAAVDQDQKPHGVAIVGRPVSRKLDDGWTLEVNRVATDQTKNACSILYAAAWRVAKAAGYLRLFTYTLDIEPGSSLKALKDMGWRLERDDAGGGAWTREKRPRLDTAPTNPKKRWAIGATPPFPPRPVFPVEPSPQLDLFAEVA